MPWMKTFALTLCSLMIAGTSHCAGINVGAFSTARADVSSVAEGPFTEELRASVIGRYPGSRFVGLDSLTPAALSAVNLVIVGAPTFSSPIFLSGAEQTALLNFIKAGGGALIYVDNDSYAGVPTSDNANETFLEPFAMDSTGRVASAALASSIAPSHPVMNGPSGTVAAFATNFGGWFDNLGPSATALAQYDTNAQPAVAAIAPGALGPASGGVVFIGDADSFVDSSDGGLFGAADNEKLFLNSISFAIPEPSTTVLLFIAGLIGAGSVGRRRRDRDRSPRFLRAGESSVSDQSAFWLRCVLLRFFHFVHVMSVGAYFSAIVFNSNRAKRVTNRGQGSKIAKNGDSDTKSSRAQLLGGDFAVGGLRTRFRNGIT